ncbi:DUF1121-domain-containing protein [Gonapodya prolifera JEL478]|uniref:DUF1121-domain-containing protein n=1 Tax=Gonapodya prolifera (strain JEL478) TaxID=1344416 RepID=A0A139AGJ6_GONPJ|nr:DUF1121-domain-containing protein [Gonapodya prolifera JEL478]|eukprot:KXS15907.1 DUF1121-domain-containing protein [Gonapodya prolifera JEL478]
MSIPFTGAELAKAHAGNALIKDIDIAKYSPAASDALFQKAVDGLTKAGFVVYPVATKAEALEKLKSIAPAGASVSNGYSSSAVDVGFIDFLKSTDKYKNYHALLLAEQDQAKQAKLRQEGYAADYFFSSPNAIGSDGVFVIADLTGTKTAGTGPSGNLVLLAGSNKIVEGGKDAALKRLYDYVVPLESLRSHLVFGVEKSAANNVVVVSGANPWGPKRIHIVLVKESLGF